jgi:hypothetical protein
MKGRFDPGKWSPDEPTGRANPVCRLTHKTYLAPPSKTFCIGLRTGPKG